MFCSYESLFNMHYYKRLRPKDSYEILVKHKKRNKCCDDYEFLCKTSEALDNLDVSSYMITLRSEYTMESCFFSIIHDSTGYYMTDSKSIKRFHNIKNALKYKLSLETLKRFKNNSHVKYTCVEYNPVKGYNQNQYIYDAYTMGRKVII